jgi:hypothetical protein
MALRNVVKALEGAEPLEQTRPLSVDVAFIGEPRKIFDGDANHPALYTHEVLAVLPFQLDERRFVFAVYVMTRDFGNPFEPQTFRITIHGLDGRKATLSATDPLTGKNVSFTIVARGKSSLTIQGPVSDCPYLLRVNETPGKSDLKANRPRENWG